MKRIRITLSNIFLVIVTVLGAGILYYFDFPRSLIRQGYRLLGQTGYSDASVFLPSEQSADVPKELSAMEEARDFVQKKLKEHKVVVFSKSYCPYCKKAKNVLSKYSISPEDYDVTELDKMDESKAAAIQDYMQTLTGAKSVPRVFINGKFVGGGDDTERLDSAGKLQEMLNAAGVH